MLDAARHMSRLHAVALVASCPAGRGDTARLASPQHLEDQLGLEALALPLGPPDAQDQGDASLPGSTHRVSHGTTWGSNNDS